MTLVMGALFPDGALLSADCRLTVVPRPGAKPFEVDDAQKILPIGQRSVVGFSGNLFTISTLLGHLYDGLPRHRTDAVSLRHWLPRFFRRAFEAIRRTYPNDSAGEGCDFLVASTVPGRPQRIRASVAWRTLDTTGANENKVWNNYITLRIWNCKPDKDGLVTVPDSSYGMLYRMRSPDFIPEDIPPLGYSAIGSGAREALRVLEHYAPIMFSADRALGSGWFMEAMASTMAATTDSRVGGLFITFALSKGRVLTFPATHTAAEGASLAEVVLDDQHFVLVDHSTGRRMRLRRPGEIDREPPRARRPFPAYRTYWKSVSLDEPRWPEFISNEQREEFLQRRAALAQRC